MKKSKKLLSLVLALAMFVTAFTGLSSTAFAAGWATNTKNVELNMFYNDEASATDIEQNDYYYDSFKFSIPAKGNIDLRIQSEADWYTSPVWGDMSMAVGMYIYSVNDLENYIWYDHDCVTKDGYNSAYGYYYSNAVAKLSAGTYILVAKYDSDYIGTNAANKGYDFCLSYSPTFSNASLKKVSAQKKAFKATWRKCSGVSGYQLQYSRKKNMKSSKTIKIKASAGSKKVKKLKKKKKYYVRIRTYKTVNVNGKNKTYYGKWSKKKIIKTK